MAIVEPNARISVSALDAYTTRQVEPIFAKKMFLGGMKANGRISFNHAGKLAETWRPVFRRKTLTAQSSQHVQIPAPQTNFRKNASLPWRILTMGESSTKFERETTSGSNPREVMFNIVADIVDRMAPDSMNSLNAKLFLDGSAGLDNEVHGLNSCLGNTGLVVTDSKVADPNDSYAGNSTALGVSGEWSPNASDGWPTGSGDSEYCWWSPFIVDYTNSGFNGSSATWFLQWQEAINYGLTYMQMVQSEMPDIIILNAELDREAKASFESGQRFEVTRGSKMVDAGIRTLNYNGVELVTDADCPDAVGYMFNWSRLKLKSTQPALFGRDTDTDILTSTDQIVMDFYGNMIIDSPAFIGQLAAIS